MSDVLLAEAEAALAFQLPDDSPGVALLVMYAGVEAVPDPVDVVELWFTLKGYPGTFVAREYVAAGGGGIDAVTRSKLIDHVAYAAWEVGHIYAVDGGWPVPPEFPPVPKTSGGPIGYE